MFHLSCNAFIWRWTSEGAGSPGFAGAGAGAGRTAAFTTAAIRGVTFLRSWFRVFAVAMSTGGGAGKADAPVVCATTAAILGVGLGSSPRGGPTAWGDTGGGRGTTGFGYRRWNRYRRARGGQGGRFNF